MLEGPTTFRYNLDAIRQDKGNIVDRRFWRKARKSVNDKSLLFVGLVTARTEEVGRAP